jgi:hypothetical protein
MQKGRHESDREPNSPIAFEKVETFYTKFKLYEA